MDASEDLQARLDELKVEIERVQAALAGLQDSEEGSPG
jgi:prefoldin subunit 5